MPTHFSSFEFIWPHFSSRFFHPLFIFTPPFFFSRGDFFPPTHPHVLQSQFFPSRAPFFSSRPAISFSLRRPIFLEGENGGKKADMGARSNKLMGRPFYPLQTLFFLPRISFLFFFSFLFPSRALFFLSRGAFFSVPPLFIFCRPRFFSPPTRRATAGTGRLSREKMG